MVDLIRKELDEAGLDSSKMISFVADNTNANFGGANRGGENNVFAILKLGILIIVLRSVKCF
jgi:hypothetical protein